MKKKVEEQIGEVRTYLIQNFSREKHEKFYSMRFKRITDAMETFSMDAEMVIAAMERERRRRESAETQKKEKINEERLVERITECNRQTVERIYGEVERCRVMMELDDVQRQEDAQRMEKVFTSRIKELETSFKGNIWKLSEDNMRVETQLTRVMEENLRCNEKCKELKEKLEKMQEITEDGAKLMTEGVEKVNKLMNEIAEKSDMTNLDMEGIKETLQAELKVARGEIKEVGKILRDETGNSEIIKDLREEGKKIFQEVRSIKETEKMETDGTWSEVVKGRRRRGPQVVIEVPKEIQSSEARKMLESCLDPKLGNVRIRAIRKQGKNFVVEMHDEDDVTNLKLLRKFDEVGFTVDGEPNLNDPRIIIYDIDSGINEEGLVIAVMLRNGYLKEGISDED
ncbi:hypothetical protein J437_LFUL004407 [Ladona fulva]|uniref:Uncharacterized protein n=1 Tax=Ladona fulva TaxID=123851 RepID=A0A8K0K1T0_LADFU|nr:hypothetical protein J437_LFUL004407 [Ladona fulva]